MCKVKRGLYCEKKYSIGGGGGSNAFWGGKYEKGEVKKKKERTKRNCEMVKKNGILCGVRGGGGMIF